MNQKNLIAVILGRNAAGAAIATGAAGVVSFATYNRMLDNCIKDTNEAIAFLEKKKAELK